MANFFPKQPSGFRVLNRPRMLAILIIAAWSAWSARGQQVSISSDGWTVTADRATSLLSVSHDKLGPVMSGVRLKFPDGSRLRSPAGWSVERNGPKQLMLRTTEPRTAWIFELSRNALRISSTSTAGVLTAELPAPANRLPVRLLDPGGVPVDWAGTAEVVHSYGGSQTRNPSFLPRRNPEVMYFALGQVAGSGFHSLFDRGTDIAIAFSDHTLLRRNPEDQNRLDAIIPVPGNTLVRLIPDYYTKTLGLPFYIPFDDAYFKRPPMVWSSWTSYYAEVTERDIIRNTDWIADRLRPYGFEYIELDDGYERGPKGEHYWIENWNREKFPHGPKWLADYIKSKGLRAGLWIVPNAYAGAVEQHPGWYLRDQQGNLIPDYHTPSLDSSNPEVMAFLRRMFTQLKDWGFDYYKFDGEHALPAYAPAVNRQKLFDKTAEPVAVYRERLKLIRSTIGPRSFIEACPAGTPLNAIGYANSYFNGEDVYNSWQGMHALFSSINANAFLNHIVVYLMPGEGLELGEPMSVEEAKVRRPPSVVATARSREEPLAGFGTTTAEARTLVTLVALSGVAYPLASVMPELPEERVKLLQQTLPAMPILPLDLFSRGTDMRWGRFKHLRADDYIHNYPEILDVKVNAKSGIYDVVGFTNWRGEKAARQVDFGDKLGLSPGSYIVFDYWKQRLLGVFADRMDLEIEPHDTRVLLIHPLMNRPQLIGISRHITGAYSVLDLSWDGAKNTLRGSSETVPGAAYAMWFYIPGTARLSQARAATEDGREIAMQQQTDGNALMISFPGQRQSVQWELHFANR